MRKAWLPWMGLAVAVGAGGLTASRPFTLRAGENRLDREVRKRIQLRYLLSLPTGYDPAGSTRWPLIVFLHGAGERGTDFARTQDLGPLGYARKHADFGFIVAAPLCPAGEDWSSEALTILLDEIQAGCLVDPDRIYLTGFSMGGAGTWKTAMDAPDRFAAIAPLCGRVIPLLGGRLWRCPIWVFHGDKDSVVPFSQSKELVDWLRSIGNTKVRFTEYAGADHEIWNRTYDNPALYAWFLEHRLSDRLPAQGR